MPDRLGSAVQAAFGGGLNAVTAPHLLAQDEVQAATNVDFSLEWGGAPVRRGCQLYAWDGLGTNTINIQLVARQYSLSTGTWNDGAIPWFAAADSGLTYTGSGTQTVTLGTVSGYAGGTQSQVYPCITVYNNYLYAANGTSAFKTNGTATYDWLLPAADTPTVTFFQQGTFTGTGPGQAGVFPALTTQTWTATEGSITGSSTSSYFGNTGGVVVNTCTSGTGSRIVIIAQPGFTNWENDVPFVVPPTGTTVTYAAGTYTLGGGIDFHQGFPNGDTTGTYTATATASIDMTIGPYGTDYILLGLENQSNVVTIQRDLSWGDTTFTNYWHSETTANDIHDASTDALVLLLNAQGNASIEVQQQALNQSRAISPNVGRRLGPSISQLRKVVGKASIAVNISPWGVARGDYQFIGTVPNPDFRNIKAVRVIVEYNTTGQQALIGAVMTYGAQGWCLNDQVTGIQYYQTYARVENGVIVAEGAPSAPSAPQKVQYAYAALNCANSTNTTAGITHRVFYRNGGLLQDAYRVGSCTITSGTATIYDYALPDMLIIGNPALKRFLWSTWPSVSAGTGLPGVNAVSEPWQQRVWVGVQNQLYWSVPGNPSQIQDDVQTTVSDVGDSIQAIISYGNLVIVNQASVYEMTGSIFEGTNANWSLQRMAARRGCAAPKTCIKTPHGIVLFSYDGISLYRAGFGIDQELDWVHDKIGDLWKGTASSDPAAVKGRIPALNQAAIFTACAAYKDDRVYLAVPTGTNTKPDTVFVLHMGQRKVWMQQYPFKINSLYFDRVDNRLMAGTDRGTIQQLETGLVDQGPTGTNTGIAWSFKTRAWSTPTDLILENLQVENVGTHTALGVVDNTNTVTLGTFSQASKGWSPESLQGTIGDNVTLQFGGTQSGAQQELYQAHWEFIHQTPRVTYYKTDPVAIPSENYIKTWLADLDPLGTATVTATLLVNGTAVTLANGGTSTALTGSVRRVFELTMPNITVGKTVQAVYQSTTPFKYWDTNFEFDEKPFEKLTWLVTYKKLGGVTQLDMCRFYAMDLEGTLTATVTNTWIIDGSAFCTDTFTLSSPNVGELTGVGRMYADQIPFPPGARGYLFQQQLSSQQPFRVWRAHLDIDRIGVKGLSRVTLAGTPTAQ